jgi:hypothetical protein
MYTIESSPTSPDVPTVQWIDEVEMTAAELLRPADSREEAPQRDEAEQAILALFKAFGETVPADKAEVELKRAGISLNTAKRAKKKLRVRSVARFTPEGGIDGWDWHMEKDKSPGRS